MELRPALHHFCSLPATAFSQTQIGLNLENCHSPACRDMDAASDVSDEPEPIMVSEDEEDGLVQRLLDAKVGLRAEKWDNATRRR